MIQDWNWFLANVKTFRNDDRLLSAYLSVINISFYNAANRFFLGHTPAYYNWSFDAVMSPNITQCDDLPKSERGCRPYFTKLSELAFWHDKGPFYEFIPRMDEIRKAAGDTMYFFVPINKPHLCRSKKQISGYYD